MSEAELHILKARMRGGQLNKARRGELEMGPPVGLVYRSDGVIDLDPDAEVQGAIRLVFETFERTGSAVGTHRPCDTCSLPSRILASTSRTDAANHLPPRAVGIPRACDGPQ